MPRKNKEQAVKSEKTLKSKKTKQSIQVPDKDVKYFVDGHGDVREYYEPVVEYVINWEKIAADVKAAAEMTANYPQDDGPLTASQIKQIKKTAPKPSKKKTT